MGLSLYEITIPVFIQHLRTLAHLLEKGTAHVADGKNDSTSLVDARLIADMGNLAYQVQRVSDTAKGLAVRVAHAAPVAMEDSETTMAQLHDRIQRTIDVLEAVAPDSMDGMEERDVVLKTRSSETTFTGTSYVLTFAIPNFYFHFTMAYALLRKEGVPVGKVDYLKGKSA
ncbi:helix-turn-helix- domain containing protein type [Phlyctema vagabunda]|uniref:Helix-turn-helix- domain containing protein type n=1 Tax=Phlyctema vagabunda TaxID=108571 RepID=A0ABR4PCD3_9HELO